MVKNSKYIIAILLSISTWLSGQNVSFKVKGLCEMCKERIETVSMNTIGVQSANWESETTVLTLTVDPKLFIEDELHKALAAAGHDTDKVKADDKVYQSLPLCCQYRQSEIPALMGFVYEKKAKSKKKEVLTGATVYWADESHATVTDGSGSFTLPMSETTDRLVIRYLGYGTDTLIIEKAGHVDILLETDNTMLDEVEIKGRRMTTSIAYLETVKTQKITSKELMKAACCNLSESFETNPSVDVSFTDAVTGARRIEMLGLAGPYVQITRELIPDIRGLSALSGFTYIPGPWVSGIQLSQGVGSVLSGFESVAGQINVNLKKPFDPEKIFINGYANNSGRYEANAIGNLKLKEGWYSNGMLHYAHNSGHNDRNKDGFLDMPTGKTFIAANTWKMDKPDTGNEAEFGIKFTNANSESGQKHEGFDHSSGPIWTAGSDAQRMEAWLKRGKVFLNAPYKSIGFQMGTTYHQADQYFGKTSYDATQKTLYANLLYQTIIRDSDNKIVFGGSFLADQVDENVNQSSYKRREYIPGVFAEMTNRIAEGFTTVTGFRTDYHNNFGIFFTPRFHARYEITHKDIIRISAGRGQRTASIFAENLGNFASSRTWVIRNENNNNPYGLNPEAAWTFGLSFVKIWNTDKSEITWGTDFYHINFQNQVVVDLDHSPRELLIYNLEGISRSNAFQSQLDFNFTNGLSVRAAYRYVDVKTDFTKGRLEKALISPHRTFLNIAYESKKGWNFDYTFNYQSSKRLPSTTANPEGLRLDDRSPAFTMSIAQISKQFKGNDIYLGVENLFDFRQEDPIIDPLNPYGRYFDASLTWGPVFGRMIYAGFRYTLK